MRDILSLLGVGSGLTMFGLVGTLIVETLWLPSPLLARLPTHCLQSVVRVRLTTPLSSYQPTISYIPHIFL